MLVPTAPVRKITSACDIWTDQTRNRTSTTVEFCIAKMMPNRSRIPPRISLNLVVMFFLVSLSRWEVTPRTLKGAGLQMYGLRQFEFKAWIMSSASVFHKTLCRRAARIECLIPVVVVSARYTLCPVRLPL
jgi:hypothetical protein